MLALIKTARVVRNGPNFVKGMLADAAPIARPELVGALSMQDAGAEGVRRLNSTLHLISTIPLKMRELYNRRLPSKQQLIADKFVRVCLPQIVSKKQWISNKNIYLKMLGETYICTMGGVIAARQYGKSWTVAVCIAAVMMSCPGITIGVYASKIAQAEVIQTYVMAIFKEYNIEIRKSQLEHSIWIEGVKRTVLTCFGFNV